MTCMTCAKFRPQEEGVCLDYPDIYRVQTKCSDYVHWRDAVSEIAWRWASWDAKAGRHPTAYLDALKRMGVMLQVGDKPQNASADDRRSRDMLLELADKIDMRAALHLKVEAAELSSYSQRIREASQERLGKE